MKTLFLLLIAALVAQGDTIKNKSQIVLSIKGVPQQDASQFSTTYEVYSNGTINLPYLASVKASGKTPAQLAAHIESLYKAKKIYTNPTVNVSNPVSKEVDTKYITFIVDSGARNVTYRRGMTLISAIAEGGGAGTFDSKRYAYVERNKVEKKYDLQNVNDRSIEIYPNDIIRLPHANSGIFNLFKKDN